MVSSIFSLSFMTVASIFFKAVSFFSTLEYRRRIRSTSTRRINIPIDHINHFRVNLLLHSLLRLLQLSCPFLQASNIEGGEIIGGSRFTKQPIHRPSEFIADKETITNSFSSAIHSCCFS